MKKEIWAIHFNDIHIKNGNEKEVYLAIEFMVNYAVKHNIKNLICGGDVFESRSFQRLSHLKCWEKCLKLFKTNNLMCYCNTGNHDKSLYNSKDNFIEPFKYHPSLRLFSDIETISLNGKQTTFSPFFTDKILCDQLTKKEGCEVLIGHWSCDGSTYLGKTDKNKVINKSLLNKWNKVFLSHYHNYHKVSENVTHLPSLIQDNYGEDNLKGFTLIYDDLSYEIIKGSFKELKKVELKIDDISIDELKKMISIEKGKDQKTRFEFYGSKSKLDALDLSIFEDSNIDVKLKYDKNYEFNTIDRKEPLSIEVYREGDIKKEFEIFCKNKEYDFDYGKALLDKFLKEKENGK